MFEGGFVKKKRSVNIGEYDNAVRVYSMLRMCGGGMPFKAFVACCNDGYDQNRWYDLTMLPFRFLSWGKGELQFRRVKKYFESIENVECTLPVDQKCEDCRYRKVCPDKTKEKNNA